MDSNNTNGVSSPEPTASTTPVVDMQPPQTSMSSSVMGDVAQSSDAPTQDSTITPDSSPAAPVSAPAGGPAAPEGNENLGAPTVPNPMADVVKQPSSQPEKKKSKAMVVIVAFVVAVALGVAAYFAYATSTKHDESAKKSTTTAAKTETVTAAKATDVDDATTEIDKSLATANDAKDFATTDLADATLGL